MPLLEAQGGSGNAMSLSAIKREAVPLHVEVSTLLSHQILSGALQPGEKLPPLDKLAEKMGVSRMTVRQAMSVLEEKGLIMRRQGKGTFVKKIAPPKRNTLKMKSTLAQLHSMVEQLQVVVISDSARHGTDIEIDGRRFKRFVRQHTLNGAPFCHADICIASGIYALAPKRFPSEIVVSLLKELGIAISTARQQVRISYADYEIAHTLAVSVNTPLFVISRQFFDAAGELIYSGNLLYPGDVLEFEIDFEVTQD